MSISGIIKMSIHETKTFTKQYKEEMLDEWYNRPLYFILYNERCCLDKKGDPERRCHLQHPYPKPITPKVGDFVKTKKTVFKIKDKIFRKKVADFRLRKPLIAHVSIIQDDASKMWCLKNNEFSTIGCGNDFKTAMESFENHFEGMVIGFLDFKTNQLAPKSLELRNKLADYIDLDYYRYAMRH